jgi:hypothetical protein
MTGLSACQVKICVLQRQLLLATVIEAVNCSVPIIMS